VAVLVENQRHARGRLVPVDHRHGRNMFPLSCVVKLPLCVSLLTGP
jgi:hypothetical protein